MISAFEAFFLEKKEQNQREIETKREYIELIKEDLKNCQLKVDKMERKKLKNLEKNEKKKNKKSPVKQSKNGIEEKKVSDQLFDLKTEFTVCYLSFDALVRVPLVMSCGHTHCRKCLEQLSEMKLNTPIRCQTCNQEMTATKGLVSKVPKNFALC